MPVTPDHGYAEIVVANAQVSTGDRQVWSSGGTRRIMLVFAFLLLLPFYASIGPMLFQRISRGLIGDTIALGVLGIAFSALMLLLLQQVVHAVRTRVVVDKDNTSLTVPDGGRRGPFFLFKYLDRKVPHADVAAVDTRSEVYGGSLAPILVRSTRLQTKAGEHIVLGFTNVNDQEDQIPYPEIGAEIARRAGVPVTDHGVVHRSVQKRVLGAASTADENRPLSEAEIAALNASHGRNLRWLIVVLAILVAGGIGIDFIQSYTSSYAQMGAGLGKPATSTPAAPKKK